MPKGTKKLELFFIFFRYPQLKVKDIWEFLPENYCTISTLYDYKKRWKTLQPKIEKMLARITLGIRSEKK